MHKLIARAKRSAFLLGLADFLGFLFLLAAIFAAGACLVLAN